MHEARTVSPAATTGHEVPRATHRWNFWVCGAEAALYMTGSRIMGPMTIIPFLFKEIGLDDAWLGLFTLSFVIMALGNPLGTALAGGRRRKLPYCVKVGVLQRLPFVMVPLGATFFFHGPQTLLTLLVLAWVTSNFFTGMTQPVFQVVATNGIRESWWARMMSLRSILAAVGGLGASGLVWWVNARCTPPHNYIVLGWSGVVLLFLSLCVASRIREVPMEREWPHGLEHVQRTLVHMLAILREDQRVRWLILGRVFRSCGFLLGTYMTTVFIDRYGLTDDQMWLPILIITVAQIVAYTISGWFVDHVGAKPGLVVSSLCVAANSALIMQADSLAAFVVVFSLGILSGSLLMSAWPTLVLKLAPIEQRPAYSSAIFLSSAPGGASVMVLGMLLVRWTGFDLVFYISGLGGLAAAVIFLFKIPHIRYAPRG